LSAGHNWPIVVAELKCRAGVVSLNEQAFKVLDAIADGNASSIAEAGPWISAFETIRWVSRDGAGLSLTKAGRQAHRDLARPRSRERRSPRRTVDDAGISLTELRDA
jgi:hypothetical protein